MVQQLERVRARDMRHGDITYFSGVRCRVTETDHGLSNIGEPVGRFRIESAPANPKDRTLPESFSNAIVGGTDDRLWVREA